MTSPHRVYFCDMRNYAPFTDQKKPPTEMRTFNTREEAVAFRATLPRDENYIVTMTAAPPPRAKRTVTAREATGVEWLGGRMRRPEKHQRLTD